VTLLHMDNLLRSDPLQSASTASTPEVLNEYSFKRMIAVERKRTERSGESFLLMLLEAGNQQGSKRNERALDSISSILPTSIRETDVIGWYKDRAVLGVMFTGIACKNKGSILSVILSKVSATLKDQLTPDQFNQVSISFHFFPDSWDHTDSGRLTNPALYPDLSGPNQGSGT
jgi:hypothetical protein